MAGAVTTPISDLGLLDADAGRWTIRPRGHAHASRRPRDGTLVLERLERAHAVFELAAAAAKDLGLLAEDVDVASGQPLGDMPQAISLIGPVHAAVAIREARERQAVKA